jgi:hypothetical protein
MADIVITATQVLPGSESATPVGAQFEYGIAGVTVTAGQPVYLDSAAGTYKLADNNDTLAAVAVVRGIALHGAAAGQPLKIQTRGPVTLGAGSAMTAGLVYVLSATAGGIAPNADIASGNRVTILGVAESASVLRLTINATGIVK